MLMSIGRQNAISQLVMHCNGVIVPLSRIKKREHLVPVLVFNLLTETSHKL